jgi:DNA-binding PadR family transcriptional regulator
MERDGCLRSYRTKTDGRLVRANRTTPRGNRALADAKSRIEELFHALVEGSVIAWRPDRTPSRAQEISHETERRTPT